MEELDTLEEYGTESLEPSRAVLRNGLEVQMKGLPVTQTDFTLRVSEDATEEEMLQIGKALSKVEKTSMVEARFKLGDWWSQLVGRYGDKRRIAEKLKPVFGRYAYKKFAEYGWVAGKWEAGRRNSNYPWSFWKNQKPGGALLEKPSKVDRKKEAIKAAVLMWDRGKWKDFETFYETFQSVRGETSDDIRPSDLAAIREGEAAV